MAVQHLCQRHGRPAVASRVRLRPDGTQEVEYLCEIDLAEEQMSGRLGGGRSLFDEFFSDFFGPPSRAAPAPTQTPARRAESVDVTQFFSDATRELLQRAAQTALEWGSLDLDSDHLLWAAPPGRRRPPRAASRSAPTPTRSRRRSRRRPRRRSGPTSRRRSPRTRRPRCSPPTRSRASSAPPTSGPSTCCSRSRGTRSRGRPAAPALRHLAHEAPRRGHPRRRGRRAG